MRRAEGQRERDAELPGALPGRSNLWGAGRAKQRKEDHIDDKPQRFNMRTKRSDTRQNIKRKLNGMRRLY
jgi:hypothetical protein